MHRSAEPVGEALKNADAPPRGLFAAHTVAMVLIQSVWFGLSSMMALLARKRFGAGDWQTLLITAAVPTLLILSIFWNDLLRRLSIGRYLMVHWACTMVPLALAALAHDFWMLLGCYLVAAAGASGWSPVSGELWKRFYPDGRRGRVFGLINMVTFLGMTLSSYAIGRLLDVHANAFRVYLPSAAVAYGAGVLILRRLVRRTGAEQDRAPAVRAEAARGWTPRLAPILHLQEVLRADRTFYRYEAAFMTYGVGWMIGNALLPILATDRLHMSYTEFAASTQVIYPLCLLIWTYPTGRLMDRIGPARVSAISFAALVLYPLGLMAAHSVTGVGVATAFYGTAMAGVQIAWMLGPVALAPSPDKVAHYVAIHATLVGLRGILAQGLGMFIYWMTGSFTWPFALAAVAYAWASWQMWRLHRLTDAGALAPGAVN